MAPLSVVEDPAPVLLKAHRPGDRRAQWFCRIFCTTHVFAPKQVLNSSSVLPVVTMIVDVYLYVPLL